MEILVTNDDGIYADGLWALAEELQKVGSVTIVAPDREQSGVGTSVTLHQPLRISKVRSRLKGIATYMVEGTPADSVILALKTVVKEKIDIIVSGINEGPNLGNDVFVSGTVGAALQSYFYKIPAIALSIRAFENPHFDAAAKLASLLARKVDDRSLPPKILLNVNLPNLPLEELKGIEITTLGDRDYHDQIEPGHDGKRQYYWITRGEAHWHITPGSDIWALEQNKVSITLLPGNHNNPINQLLQKLAPILFQELLTR